MTVLEVVPAPDGGSYLLADGVVQSHVDLEHPTRIAIPYVRDLADLVDALPPGPANVLHLGGAGCTLARYTAATRPGSHNVVVDSDKRLPRLLARHLPIPPDTLELHTLPAQTYLRRTRTVFDLIVIDLFTGPTPVPIDLELAASRLTRTGLLAHHLYAPHTGHTIAVTPAPRGQAGPPLAGAAAGEAERT